MEAGTYDVGNMPPALPDKLQHGVGSGRFSLDFHRHHAKQQDLPHANST